MLKKSSLALIVPCYNEVDCIPFFEKELRLFLEELKRVQIVPNIDFSVLIVDNNSTDGSLELLKKLEASIEGLQVISCPVQGYGAALKYGYAHARADYLAFLDLDNTYPLKSLIDMWKKLHQEDLDIVYGARIHSNSDISIIRSLGNRLYVWLLRVLLGSKLSDVCSGMRIFKASKKGEVIALKDNGLAFSIEFTALSVKNKWKLSEVPIAYRDRVGDSKLSVVKDGFLFLFVVMKKWQS
ncbi:glycosyltransferase family 2 protein [Pseudobdellovibrio exovorus]|uniref:Glycosyltransferase 2-like domain-containing protein n=1 Tax=Pseudobdellovibrio exovorus JSS TaxID=1184267 RepID=M4V8R6_9BACT|nr:glycosyltransferase family 2 protein [Pseudobdellovibrio exovorus]AGH95603.1 hypothetical protein A11Q_1387 [Pseudobdellovibrio exovorus JSS]